MNNIFEDIISMNIKDILDNLNTISQIKPHDKLYHDETKIYIENAYIPSITRWYRGSGRLDTLKFIKYIFTQTSFQLDLLAKRKDSDSIYLHRCLLNGLKNTNIGLLNLQKTYENDMEIYRKIYKIMNNIQKIFS